MKPKTFASTILAALAVLHISLAIAYATVTPYRTAGYLAVMKTIPWSPVPDIGAPDERQHANYVINILQGKGLPVYRVMVADPSHPGRMVRNPNLSEVYESHQAPLFYLADAAFGRLVGIDAASAQNPERGFVLRYLNALFGAGTVIGVYFLAVWGLGRVDVGLLAAGITALLPMNLALSGAISNDPLLFCVCTWTLAVCALGVRGGWNAKRYLALGALVGLGLLTKTTALALLPLAILAFALRRPSLKGTLASGALAMALVGPWFLRNQRLYGDPLGLRSFQELFAGAPQAKDLVAVLGPYEYWVNWVGWFTVRSFFGVFGYMDIFLNERGVAYTGPASPLGPAAPNTLYRLLLALAVIASLGFVLQVAQGKGHSRSDWKVHLLNGGFLCLIGILFLRYNISFFQGQARYFYPAIGPISIGLAIGAIYWAKSWKKVIFGAIVALLLGVNLYALAKLPSEFAKRENPSLANLSGLLDHPKIGDSRVPWQRKGPPRRLE